MTEQEATACTDAYDAEMKIHEAVALAIANAERRRHNLPPHGGSLDMLEGGRAYRQMARAAIQAYRDAT